MTYKEKISKGIFLNRPNRFIAEVDVNGAIHKVHVKNTGRCKELLIPGTTVYLAISENPERKTFADLIAVEKNSAASDKTALINIDSQAPNTVVSEWLAATGGNGIFSEKATVKREAVFGNSRFDILVTDGERKAFIEVKGVTLENNGTAMFPDAPTARGVKHLKELSECLKEGYEAYVFFVIQLKGANVFTPNTAMHPEFANELKNAIANGVTPLVYDCLVTSDGLHISSKVKLML